MGLQGGGCGSRSHHVSIALSWAMQLHVLRGAGSPVAAACIDVPLGRSWCMGVAKKKGGGGEETNF